VFGIARRVALELRKARRRAPRWITEDGAPPAAVADHRARNPEADLLDREALQVVERALARLPEDRRAVLLLRLDHELSYDAIAQAMDWSLAKVKVPVLRAGRGHDPRARTHPSGRRARDLQEPAAPHPRARRPDG
jgi:RNA polymerase sigma-70 factor (ECF subfamily)